MDILDFIWICLYLKKDQWSSSFSLIKMVHISLHDGNSSSSHSSVNEELLSRTGYTILAVIMGVFSVCGIFLNVLVIVVTVRHRQLRQPLSYALVNLAICDLGCAVFGGLPTTVTSAMGYFSLGRTGCVLEGFAVSIFGESIKSQAVCLLLYTDTKHNLQLTKSLSKRTEDVSTDCAIVKEVTCSAGATHVLHITL